MKAPTSVPFRCAAICALLAGSVVTAQHEADPRVPSLHDAFAQMAKATPPGRPVLAIAVVGDHEPVVLCAGPDDAGAAATASTPLPIGPLVRLLIADALATDKNRGADLASGVSLGGRALTRGELVAGVPAVPDYYTYDGTAPLDRAVLLRCAEVAAAANETYWEAGGAGELLLLEPSLFDAAPRDWAGWLRVRLAPHVSGFGPLAADELDGAALANARAAAAAVRGAQPSALRLLLTGKELAAWWRWRVGTQPVRSGSRVGNETSDPSRGTTTWWRCGHSVGPATFAAAIVGERRAGVLIVGADARTSGPLEAAFLDDVLGQTEPGVRLGGRMVGKPPPPLRALLGKWTSAPGSARCTIEITDGKAQSLTIDFGDRRVTSTSAQQDRSGTVRVGLGYVDGAANMLVLVPGPAGEPRRCTALLQERRGGLAAVPHCFELVRDGG